MRKNKLFAIGDVARHFHLSAGTLRHYEREGLLTPEYVDADSGYRFYGYRQFEVLSTICYLRTLDLSLTEIACFLKNRNINKIEKMLLRQKAAVVQKQKELKRIKRKIDNRLQWLQDVGKSRFDEIREIELPECRIAEITVSVQLKSAFDMEAPVRKLEEVQAEAVIFLGKVGCCISAENLRAGKYDNYDSVFLLLDDEDRFVGKVSRLPPVKAVSIRFRGHHAQAPEQYRKLAAYMAENGLEIAGFSREITLVDQGVENNSDKFVTEISIPVFHTAGKENK